MLPSTMTLHLLSLGLSLSRISVATLRGSVCPESLKFTLSSQVCPRLSLNSYSRTVRSSSNCQPMSTIRSVHSDQVAAAHNIPMSAVIRPLPSELDEAKVQSLMKTLQNPKESESVPPIDILWITGREGGNYYYAFGGCHRWEAHKRLGRSTIQAKLVQSTVQDLRTYLGASTPDLR